VTARFLVDTSVLSLLAPGKSGVDPDLAAWLRAKSELLRVSAVTIAEIEQGIRKLRRTGGTARAKALESWLDALVDGAGDRVLPLDVRTARIAGAISDRAMAAGNHPGFAGVAIAATALAHGLTLLTRNTKHFAPLGVAFADPDDPPSD
jgi:predicted nucleic acid-binding protein